MKLTVEQRILELQATGGRANPLWRKEFLELLASHRALTDFELRLVATIAALDNEMRKKKSDGK